MSSPQIAYTRSRTKTQCLLTTFLNQSLASFKKKVLAL